MCIRDSGIRARRLRRGVSRIIQRAVPKCPERAGAPGPQGVRTRDPRPPARSTAPLRRPEGSGAARAAAIPRARSRRADGCVADGPAFGAAPPGRDSRTDSAGQSGSQCAGAEDAHAGPSDAKQTVGRRRHAQLGRTRGPGRRRVLVRRPGRESRSPQRDEVARRRRRGLVIASPRAAPLASLQAPAEPSSAAAARSSGTSTQKRQVRDAAPLPACRAHSGVGMFLANIPEAPPGSVGDSDHAVTSPSTRAHDHAGARVRKITLTRVAFEAVRPFEDAAAKKASSASASRLSGAFVAFFSGDDRRDAPGRKRRARARRSPPPTTASSPATRASWGATPTPARTWRPRTRRCPSSRTSGSSTTARCPRNRRDVS